MPSAFASASRLALEYPRFPVSICETVEAESPDFSANVSIFIRRNLLHCRTYIIAAHFTDSNYLALSRQPSTCYRLQLLMFCEEASGRMNKKNIKSELSVKLLEIIPILNEVEQLNLLAAVRCLSCRNFENCETAKSNVQSLKRSVPHLP